MPRKQLCTAIIRYTPKNEQSRFLLQVDEAQYLLTKQDGILDAEKEKLKNIGIDWSKTTWQDLRKPLFSGIAAAMYATIQAGAAGVPNGIEYQAVFWQNTTRPLQEVNVFYKGAQKLETGLTFCFTICRYKLFLGVTAYFCFKN